MNDEWELYAMNAKSESDANECVNQSDFEFA